MANFETTQFLDGPLQSFIFKFRLEYSYIALLESQKISREIVAIQTFTPEFTKFLITFCYNMYKQDLVVLEKLTTFYFCSARKDTQKTKSIFTFTLKLSKC